MVVSCATWLTLSHVSHHFTNHPLLLFHLLLFLSGPSWTERFPRNTRNPWNQRTQGKIGQIGGWTYRGFWILFTGSVFSPFGYIGLCLLVTAWPLCFCQGDRGEGHPGLRGPPGPPGPPGPATGDHPVSQTVNGRHTVTIQLIDQSTYQSINYNILYIHSLLFNIVCLTGLIWTYFWQYLNNIY